MFTLISFDALLQLKLSYTIFHVSLSQQIKKELSKLNVLSKPILSHHIAYTGI